MVDDEPDLVTLFKTYLEFKHYDVVTASNGQEGINKAIEETPDLILLDIRMPVKDGVSALKELKRDEITRYIPVVMFTIKSDLNTIRQCLDLGAKDYILKTYPPEQILRYINRHILSEPEKDRTMNSRIEQPRKMDIEVEEKILQETDCLKNFCCMISDCRAGHMCKVVFGMSDSHLFVDASGKDGCNAQARFGNQTICKCRMRSYIFAKYKI